MDKYKPSERQIQRHPAFRPMPKETNDEPFDPLVQNGYSIYTDGSYTPLLRLLKPKRAGESS